MSGDRPQLLPLTGIRFLLVLWVAVFHQTLPDGSLSSTLSTTPAAVFCLLRTGYTAVGIFFVLSGFVLSYNYPLGQAWSASQLTRYGVARFSRIYPAYCIGLLLSVPAVLLPLERSFSLRQLEKQLGVAALNLLLLQAWIPQTALTWNAPGWSLSNEAFFYCCFPFLEWPSGNYRARRAP